MEFRTLHNDDVPLIWKINGNEVKCCKYDRNHINSQFTKTNDVEDIVLGDGIMDDTSEEYVE